MLSGMEFHCKLASHECIGPCYTLYQRLLESGNSHADGIFFPLLTIDPQCNWGGAQ